MFECLCVCVFVFEKRLRSSENTCSLPLTVRMRGKVKQIVSKRKTDYILCTSNCVCVGVFVCLFEGITIRMSMCVYIIQSNYEMFTLLMFVFASLDTCKASFTCVSVYVCVW